MARPTLLTPERHKAIVAAIRAGAFDWIAAEANGIDRETFKLWMRTGARRKREPYLSSGKAPLFKPNQAAARAGAVPASRFGAVLRCVLYKVSPVNESPPTRLPSTVGISFQMK